MASNNILKSAAYSGFLTGAQQQANLTAVEYTLLRAQAVLFATAVDAAIPNDATISSGGGAQGVTAFTTGGASCKTQILKSICASVWNGRNPVGNPPASYTSIATAIALLYQAAILEQTIP